MRFYFTKHSKEKIILVRRSGFLITIDMVKKALINPLKIEDRFDGTCIATSILDKKHVLRVVYRVEGDIMVVITIYPGRRKAYGI